MTEFSNVKNNGDRTKTATYNISFCVILELISSLIIRPGSIVYKRGLMELINDIIDL